MLHLEERAVSVDRAPRLNHRNHRTALTWRRPELTPVEVDVKDRASNTDTYKAMILAVEEDAMASAEA
jgi:hypothetical protein